MMKSTGIVRKAIYLKDGKIGIVKDLIIETGPSEQERLSLATNSPKGYASPDWWVSHLEIELDETFKKELVTAKKLAPSKTTETFALKLTGFGKDAVSITDKGVEIKALKAQAGDNIGTMDAFFKPTKIVKTNLIR